MQDKYIHIDETLQGFTRSRLFKFRFNVIHYAR